MKPFEAENIEKALDCIDKNEFFDELVDSLAYMKFFSSTLEESVAKSICKQSFLWNENRFSSSMEDTRISLEDSLENRVTECDSKDLNDLDNYMDAMSCGLSYLIRDGKFSEAMILNMHKILLSGNVHKTSENIGCYRTIQNFIQNKTTKEISYVPPEPSKVKKLMDNLINYMNCPSSKQRNVVNAALIHAQFETIHPFDDGNGRVGRMLITLFLSFNKEIDNLNLFLSEGIEREKHRYYKYLNDIRTKGAWNEWIKFFLNVVVVQCKKYSDNIHKVDCLYKGTIEKIDKISSSQLIKKVMDCFFAWPVNTTKSLEKETGLSNTTINRILDKLVENNIVFSNQRKRSTTYFFYDLMELL